MPPSIRRKFLIAIYVGTALYVLPMFPHGGSANELTRWATSASLIEKGSFEILWTEDLIGPNVDTAKIADRTYSNKAPGTAILAAPVYALTRLFIGPPNASNIRTSWFAMRLAISTLPLLLLAIWLYRCGTDEFALATLLFATPLFVYSLLLFSHVFVAVLVYAAFRLLFDQGESKPVKYLCAGLISGLAVISEFPVVFAIAVFGVGLLFTDKRDRLKRIGLFILGGLPFVIFLLIYNNELFGSPLSMSYAHESLPEWAEVAGKGVFGIGIPTFSNVYLLLFSPSRGLFFFAPILILAAINFVTSPERHTLRYRVKVVAIIVSVVLLCGHGAAHGGWAFGPRYLVFVLPLMLDSIFRGELDKLSNILQGFLFGVSFALCTIGILTFPFAPPEFSFPHNDFWFAFMHQEGWFVPTLASVLGFDPGFWTLFPVIAGFAMVLFIVYLGMRTPNRFLAGLVAAIALSAVYLLFPNLDKSEPAKFRRATIAERYFRPTGRLDAARNEALAKNDFAALRRVNEFEWTVANIRAYAPDDFPYLNTRQLSPSPSAMLKSAVEFQKQGKVNDAIATLSDAKARFPGLACEFAANLAVVYYSSGSKDKAQAELENIVPQVNRGSLPDCLRSQFLLGSLYREIGRQQDSDDAFRQFLANSIDSTDPLIKDMRGQLGAK